MKDPVLIGGKGSSPGPKILKKMVQEKLVPSKLITTKDCLFEEYLLKGVKEKVDSFQFSRQTEQRVYSMAEKTEVGELWKYHI